MMNASRNAPDAPRVGNDHGCPQDEMVRRQEWESGFRAGQAWAHKEAEAGYWHPLELPSGREGTVRMLIEHAPFVFGGLCRGKSRAFLRGFVEGVAEFWRRTRHR